MTNREKRRNHPRAKKVYTKKALDLLDELFPEEETNNDD